MESILNLVVNAENVRIALLAVLGFCGYVLMSRRMDRMEYSLSKRIDAVDRRIDNVEFSLNKKIDDLKYNDFAHLSSGIGALTNTIKALTFTLEKNGSLTKEDKEYIDTHLAI